MAVNLVLVMLKSTRLLSTIKIEVISPLILRNEIEI